MINPFDIDELEAMELKDGSTVGESLPGYRIINHMREAYKNEGEKVRPPKEVMISRPGDMARDSKLEIIQQDDGDMCLAIYDGESYATIEFCVPIVGGGKSPKTLEALRNLAVAMMEDSGQI